MARDSKIMSLSALISSRTAQIDEYLRRNNISAPSLDVGAAPILPLPPHLMQARAEILVATDELQSLIAGPLEILSTTISPTTNINVGLDAVDRFDILSQIKVGEEIETIELAKKCGLDESCMRQLMRILVAKRFFSEPHKDVFAHNATSQLLAENPQIRGWFQLFIRDMWPLSFRTVDAIQKWPGSQEPQETACFLKHGITFWDRIHNDAGFSERFSATMTYLSALPEFDNQYLVDYLEWDNKSCPKLMVDIGGHNGAIGAYVLRRFPSLKCIVQDLPHVVDLATVPEDLHGRLEFQAHDFFTEQNVQADVYFFRSIFHDWPNSYAQRIIRNLIPALKPGVRIIMNEVCLPEPGVVPYYFEQFIRGYDLAMRQQFNSQERSVDDWQKLFDACDERFEFSRVRQSPGSALALIEFIWNPKSS